MRSGPEYVARKRDQRWWLGFRYSDGWFDPIASYGTEVEAYRAAERLNGAMDGSDASAD